MTITVFVDDLNSNAWHFLIVTPKILLIQCFIFVLTIIYYTCIIIGYDNGLGCQVIITFPLVNESFVVTVLLLLKMHRETAVQTSDSTLKHGVKRT